MTDLKQAAQQALEALVTCCAEEWRTLHNFGMRQVYDEKKVNAAIAALHAALAEPQTTHWEGCEAVHPECKTEHGVKDLSNYEFKTYNIGGFHLGEGFYSAAELREMVKEFDAMDAAAKRSTRRMK